MFIIIDMNEFFWKFMTNEHFYELKINKNI